LVLRSTHVGDGFLGLTGKVAHSLHTLDLHRCMLITDGGIAQLVSNGLKLRHLDLSNLNVSDRAVVSLSKMDSLVSLDLRSCKLLTEAGILSLIHANASTLQSLDLNGCTGATPSTILKVAEFCNGVLKELEIGGTIDAASWLSHTSDWLDQVRSLLGDTCHVHAAFQTV